MSESNEREALARLIHDRFEADHVPEWDALDEFEQRDSLAWDMSEAILDEGWTRPSTAAPSAATVSEAAVEAAVGAIRYSRGRTRTYGEGYTASLARAALTAALPHLTPHPDEQAIRADQNERVAATLRTLPASLDGNLSFITTDEIARATSTEAGGR